MAALGVRRHPLRWRRTPSPATIGRVLGAIAGDALDAAVGPTSPTGTAWPPPRRACGSSRWTARRTPTPAPGTAGGNRARSRPARSRTASAASPSRTRNSPCASTATEGSPANARPARASTA
ncbi:hypothetical protein GTY58_04585 [Streptomyces sp. SID5469]|nr:hypothetical protein [Streptomyces sp. SID5469]